MKLIVGLGNPGRKYAGTRHNVGFDVIACLARRCDIGQAKSKFNAEIAETQLAGEKIILASPLTYMNLSGQSVRAAVDFYKLDLDDLLIICDDLALDVGRIRIKPAGSAGGQKGLKDIIEKLGGNNFARLRIGIGKTPDQWETSDYVLGKFSPDQKADIDASIPKAADAVESWVKFGIEATMNRFNAKPGPKNPGRPESNSSPPDSPSTSESSEP